MTPPCIAESAAPIPSFGRKFNALKTGWTAETALLPGENSQAFLELPRQFFLEHLPQGPTEAERPRRRGAKPEGTRGVGGAGASPSCAYSRKVKLVTAMAKGEWRGMRIESCEAGVIEKDGFGSKTYNNRARYPREARAEFYKALHALMAWRRLAIQQERHDETAPERTISTRAQRDETRSAIWHERVLGTDADDPQDDSAAAMSLRSERPRPGPRSARP